jgi:ABC-type glycerol-3-phosphate transport system substrate-binding protein
MRKISMSKTEEKKVSRRRFLEVTGGAVAGLAVGGAVGYLAKPTVTAPSLTSTVTQTVTGAAPVTTAIATGRATGAALSGTINLYAMSWGVPGCLAAADLYHKSRPNVLVNVIEGPSDWESHVSRSTVWMKTKYTGVDVLFHDDMFTGDGAYTGAWVKLDDYITPEEKAWFIGLQAGYIKNFGGIYRIPWGSGSSFIYYRKDLFTKAGVSPPKTWDELVTVATKLTKAPDQYGYVTEGTPGEMYNTYNEFLHQAGGDEWRLAPGGVPDPAAKKALQFLVDLENKYKVMPPGITAVGYTEAEAMLKTGKAAMLRDWLWIGSTMASPAPAGWGMADKIDAMNFPAGDAGAWGIGDCWGFVVNAYGANKPLGIDFVLFCLENTDARRALAKAYGAPGYVPEYQDAAFMSDIAKGNIGAAHIVEYAQWRFPRHEPPGHSVEFHEAFGRDISRALTGELSVDDALIATQKDIDPLLPKT